MCKFNPKNDSRFIDPCMKMEIAKLNMHGFMTLACCCGHGKYPMTIIVKSNISESCRELFSGIVIPRKKRFYRKDKQGVYYIPEAIGEKSKRRF